MIQTVTEKASLDPTATDGRETVWPGVIVEDWPFCVGRYVNVGAEPAVDGYRVVRKSHYQRTRIDAAARCKQR